MAKNKNKKKSGIQIKEPTQTKTISSKKLDEYNYPIFCFKHLSDVSFKDCKDVKFFKSYLSRLKGLSELGWSEIEKSDKHQYGIEKLPKESIKHSLPSFVTPEVTKVDVFRATGDNKPFVGLRNGNVFQVFFIESSFGDIYDHTP